MKFRCTNNGKFWCLCAERLYTLASVLPVGASFWDPPHLNAFEGPSGAYCHVDVAVPVRVEALSGSRAFGAHSPTGMKNPFFGCTWRKKQQQQTFNTSQSNHTAAEAHTLYSGSCTFKQTKKQETHVLKSSVHHRFITLFVSHSFHITFPTAPLTLQ